ncbi:MAG: glycosyltransferase [Acidobacteriota bacterium]|jgi:tetratricopeptide (TPR) repeat protein|nr:glycosyltransferase [Acidobacteriota bacterium]
MPLISLAMIVKNEEATLAHCLESVRLLADEMIVVDTGSTDGTIDIAKGFGAQVHHFKWRDDFAAARNESLKRCGGDWALILDADEAIDRLDHEKIRNACLRPFADAYEVTNRNYMHTSTTRSHDIGAVPNKPDELNDADKPAYSEGRDLPFYADMAGSLRLARMFDGLAFSDRIHETLGKSLVSHGKTIKPLDAVIHHYGTLFKERLEHKAPYYLMLARREADENPSDAMVQFNLLQQALVAKQWELALKTAQTSLKLSASVHPLVYYGAGVSQQQLGRHKDAIQYFDELLGRDPRHALSIQAKGVSKVALGDFNTGRKLILKAIEIKPDNISAHVSLAELELGVNNFDAARKIALAAINISPNEPAMYNLLVKIELARNNHLQAAQDAMLGLQKCPSGGEGLWHRIAAVYLIQAGERKNAASILEMGLKAFPDDPNLTRLKGMV